MTQYDDDKWFAAQIRAVQGNVVDAFRVGLSVAPKDSPVISFLVQQGFDVSPKTAVPELQQALSSTVTAGAARNKFAAHFGRAVLGGPEGLLHAADLGVTGDAIEEQLAAHKWPEGVSEKAQLRSAKLSEITTNVELAIKNRDLEGAMRVAFGQSWIDFRASFFPDPEV